MTNKCLAGGQGSLGTQTLIMKGCLAVSQEDYMGKGRTFPCAWHEGQQAQIRTRLNQGHCGHLANDDNNLPRMFY